MYIHSFFHGVFVRRNGQIGHYQEKEKPPAFLAAGGFLGAYV